MTDYISRDAAIESFRKNLDGGYVLTNDAQTTHILQSLPAADVVPMDFHERCLRIEIQKRMALEKADVREVVYCKDCRHRDPEDHKCDCGGTERQGCPFKVADDYFCAYGER